MDKNAVVHSIIVILIKQFCFFSWKWGKF